MFRISERFRDKAWQRVVRRGITPVTIGVVIAGGYVVALAGNSGWLSGAVTAAAAASLLFTRISPLWLLAGGGVLGGLGLL